MRKRVSAGVVPLLLVLVTLSGPVPGGGQDRVGERRDPPTVRSGGAVRHLRPCSAMKLRVSSEALGFPNQACVPLLTETNWTTAPSAQ